LRRNLPSLAWSGPPQQRHATSPSVAGPGRASNPTTSYFAAQTGQWNSVAIDFIHTRGFAIQFGLVVWPRSFIVALGGSRSPGPLANRHTQGNSTPARTSLGNDAAWASFRPRFPYLVCGESLAQRLGRMSRLWNSKLPTAHFLGSPPLIGVLN
jgi:hypothetical protein